jgi:hypothetical protein
MRSVPRAFGQVKTRPLPYRASRHGDRHAVQPLALGRGRRGRRVWALEGSGCYGAGLARFLQQGVSACSKSSGRSAPAGWAEVGRARRLPPGLLRQPGVGPISAAAILVSWSHRGRLRSEACFARLAGAAPIPASSGQSCATGSTAAAIATAPCTASVVPANPVAFPRRTSVRLRRSPRIMRTGSSPGARRCAGWDCSG